MPVVGTRPTLCSPMGMSWSLRGEISPLLGVDALPQVWQVSSGTWRDLTTAQFDLPLYPEMFLAPNGTLFLAGPSPLSEYLNTDGTGSWTIGPSVGVRESRLRSFGHVQQRPDHDSWRGRRANRHRGNH